MRQELVGRKQPALNPKANPDIVAEKKEIESLLASYREELETGKRAGITNR